MVREDLVALAALANPDVSSADPAVVAFRRGDAHEVPRGLHGLAAASLNGAVAWVAHSEHAPPIHSIVVEDTTFHEPTQAHARLGARGAPPSVEPGGPGRPHT